MPKESVIVDINNKPVTITTDGTKTRLDAVTKIEGRDTLGVVREAYVNEANRLLVQSVGDTYESPSRYQLETAYNAVGVQTIYQTDTTLINESGSGILDFLAITGSNSNFLVSIWIDGTERLRIAMADLGTALGLNLATNVDIWVEVAGKNFRYKPSNVGYGTSFQIKVAATQSSQRPTVTYLGLWRNVVTV